MMESLNSRFFHSCVCFTELFLDFLVYLVRIKNSLQKYRGRVASPHTGSIVLEPQQGDSNDGSKASAAEQKPRVEPLSVSLLNSASVQTYKTNGTRPAGKDHPG